MESQSPQNIPSADVTLPEVLMNRLHDATQRFSACRRDLEDAQRSVEPDASGHCRQAMERLRQAEEELEQVTRMIDEVTMQGCGDGGARRRIHDRRSGFS